MPKRPIYVDLFAGCGGLSLGLEQAGFELALAVEKSQMAAETFYHNFIERITDQDAWAKFASPSTSVMEQASKKLVVKELAAVLECRALLDDLRARDIDLVAGGPPCQGFSLAGRRNPEDIRNQLPWQFLGFVDAVEPKAVVIENVSGMSQDFKKHGKESSFGQLRLALKETGPGYEVQPVLLNAMHFGAPQHRPRVMLLALRADVAKASGLQFSERTWKSAYDGKVPEPFFVRPGLVPAATHFPGCFVTVKQAIEDLDRDGYKQVSNLSDYAKEMRNSTGWGLAKAKAGPNKRQLHNHVVRKHSQRVETRFRLYQYFLAEGVHPKVFAIPKSESTPAEARKTVRGLLSDVTLPAASPDGTILARTKPELINSVMSLGTKKHSQRPLDLGKQSPTVVSVPDDFVHPTEPRTLTVRELARFQSFPDAFEFRAKETTGSLRRRFEVPQYTQVGNAVPPKLAVAVGLSVKAALELAKSASLKKAS